MKAHKLKKTGGLLSIAGPVTAIAGIGLVSASLNGGSEGMYSLGLGMMLVGTGATIVGLPLLLTGSSRVNNVKKAISASLGVASIAPAPFSLHNYKNQNLQPGLRLSIIF
jgi:hypothetical protein